MKLFQDYKKQFKNTRQDLVLITLLILILIPFAFSYAETALEIQNKIKQKDADITRLEQEIAAYQAELDVLGKQKNSLNSSLKALDLTKKKINTDIAVTQKKIDKTNLTIQNLSSDISNKEDIIINSINSIKLEIRNTSELEENSILENILSNNDFTVIWNDIDNIATVRERLRADIVNLKQTKGALENTRKTTIDAKNELTKLKSQLSDQQKIVTQNKNEKNKLLAQTKNSEANYEKLVKNQLAKKEAFEKELRDFEAQLRFVLDPSKLPSAGVLSWPLDIIFITQEFGAKTGPHRTYTSGHSGTDFRARTPLPVKAMADGIIKGIGDTDASCPGVSFGKWIFIEYNNGLSSAYGHLSLIKVTEGQRVARGEIVGYTGGTGRVTGPHLHVSLYAGSAVSVVAVPSKSCPGRILKQPVAATNAYLDPMYYLTSKI